jgi:hypothetical protein
MIYSDKINIGGRRYNQMGVRVSVTVKLPGGSLASGSDISLVNRNAKFKDSQNWNGTADSEGNCIWEEMDSGTFGLGDIYDFQASFTDPSNGKSYIGHKTERIKKDQNVTIYLREAHMGETFELKISKDDLTAVSKLSGGEEILSVIRELSVTTKDKLSHASVMLESYIVESFIRNRLHDKGLWKDNFEKISLGMLLEKAEVKEILGGTILRRISILNELRTAAVHPKGVETYFEEASIGLGLIRELIRDWFRNA